MIMTRKILVLAANPKSTSRLRLDEEVREIDDGLNRAKHRDQFEVIQRWAVRPRDIHRAMLEVNPQIVHFAGHGAGKEGLIFEDETGHPKFVTQEALAGLFELFADQVECVVLNGCYSRVQAETIALYIPYVIGMNQEIGDKAAINFAVGFYDALGNGRPIEFAYKLGCSVIQLEGIAEHLTPILLRQSTIGSATAQIIPDMAFPSESPVSSTQPVNALEIAPPPSSLTATSSFQKRLSLFQLLSSLPGPQFEQIVFVLQPPAGNVPPTSAPQGQRVPALLEWAESPIGCGLDTLEQVLHSIKHTR
jgi:hypothetical protein